MLDGEFTDFESFPVGEHGEKTVKLSVDAEMFHDIAPVCLQTAIEIVDFDARHAAYDEIEQPGGNGLRQGIMPDAFPSRYKVVSLLQFAPECGNFGRVILKVRIHGDDDGSLSPVKADSQGGRFPIIAPEADRMDVTVNAFEIAQHTEGAVGAAIINEQDLVAHIHSPENLAELLM
jgi:hypothetical protein